MWTLQLTNLPILATFVAWSAITRFRRFPLLESGCGSMTPVDPIGIRCNVRLFETTLSDAALAEIVRLG